MRNHEAAAMHTALGRNVWFTVELARRGPRATVKVNDQTVFANIPATQLDNGINSGRIRLDLALGARASLLGAAKRQRRRPF